MLHEAVIPVDVSRCKATLGRRTLPPPDSETSVFGRPSLERDRFRGIFARHPGCVRRVAEWIEGVKDIAVKQPGVALRRITERYEIGPMGTARDTVLHGEIILFDGDSVITVFKRVTLAAVVGTQHDRLIARGELVGTVGFFLENQEGPWRGRIRRILVSVDNDEPRVPPAIDHRAWLEDHRLETGR